MAEIVRKRSIHIRDARIAGLYDLEHTIGQGHFAVVKLARHVFTGERVAVKIIDKSNLDAEATGHVMQEVRCMKLVQHANIVRLYEVIDTNTKLFLILELGDYDMHDFIIKHENGVAEPLAQQYFCQIITAIDYCHRLHVVHRDLKPENVVFFEKLGMVKLTDFGFSNLFEPGQQLRTSCGSLAYSAPEILLGDAYDAPAVDVWSLGVILFMLVCGRLPFQEANDSETLTKILDCRYTTPEHLSNACKNLIQRMLVRDPSKRAGLAEIVANPWVIAGDRGHAAALPLIVKHHLPHSAHTTIIEQMVAGGVGTEDAILKALENDDYNSMTATYYLLAERILASCREEQAKELMAKTGRAVPEEELLENESRTPNAAIPSGSRCRSRSNSWRARPCSILKEESEEELSTYMRSSRHSSRNSSPSISMFSGARDRVSPQAVQDLLELCRLGSGRRAASPESMRSSRSPSPPTSSGRTSPAMSSLSSLSRLKVSSSSVGMRKLSSSPHLLGICEEGEDVETNTTLLTTSRPSGARANSSVRMIRPRHAVVSPDVCRRYDQHQRLIARSRRSTSCSSSEASDDEEGKRMSVLVSKYCGRKRDGDNDDDDKTGGDGGVGGGSRSENDQSGPSASNSKPNSHSSGESMHERRSGGAAEGCLSAGQQHLFPIPEMTHLDSDRRECLRAKLLHRSHTAERIARDCASLFTRNYAREISCFGTPPRDVALFSSELNQCESDCWIRTLKRTRSDERIRLTEFTDGESMGDSVFDAPIESIDSSRGEEERGSDSGCSSEKVPKNTAKKDIVKNNDMKSLPPLDPLLLYDQPRCEKVNCWLRSAHFV
ncbi:kinase domain protein [Necator americanus]|uniref:SNF-related serine/threonine-protein kinase n=1 Tax=Necator americanus TaxID=51031 RepID=W2TJC3_NECAM|nr:kinase domain protein [Necator americanus]ETN81127.1 kinase domain protein [Necator americanus]